MSQNRQYHTFPHSERKSQQGLARERGFWCRAGSWPATSLLPAVPAQRNPSASQRMSQLKLRREEDPRLSSMSTLSSMNTVYATGSLSSNRTTPPPSTTTITPASPHHHRYVHRNPSCLPCLVSSFCLSHSFFYRLNQERCSPSVANWLKHRTFITWQLGVCRVEMHEKGSVLRRGMWAHPRGHHCDPTLYQHYRRWPFHARFVEESVKNNLDTLMSHPVSIDATTWGVLYCCSVSVSTRYYLLKLNKLLCVWRLVPDA